jgi:hypothetical protein
MEPNVLTETEVPSIPEPVAANILEAIGALKQLVEIREGLIGDPLDQVVTYRELYQMGWLDPSILDGRRLVRLPGLDVVSFLDPPKETTAPEYAPPPAVSGLQASGALANVIISFDAPQYHNHAHTEIWRAGTDDLGAAIRLGTTSSNVYTDNLGTTGATRYYWVRNVSKVSVVGPFNATAGTSATTGLIVGGDLTDASVTIQKIKAKRIEVQGDTWNDNTPGGGSVSWSAMTIAYDGTTTAVSSGNTANKWIYWTAGSGALSTSASFPSLADNQFLVAVNNAGIHDLVWNANGIATQVIDTALIGDAVIGTAQIQNLAVTNGKIGNLAVDAAKIANATITTGKIGNLQVTDALIANATITGGKIAAATITADRLTVTTLSAITANMGTLTAGTIALASSGHIRAGQTAYATGTGFFLGFDGATPKFSLGSSTRYARWDGTDLLLAGDIYYNGILEVYANTADGADNQAIRIGGGGSLGGPTPIFASRGAYLYLTGNEHNGPVGFPGDGDAWLVAGATGDVTIAARGASQVFIGDDTISIGATTVSWNSPTHSSNHIFSGNLTANGNVVIGNAGTDTLTIAPSAVTWSNDPTHSGTHTFSGVVNLNSSITVGGSNGIVIDSVGAYLNAIDTDNTVISGGTTSTTGGNLFLFGPSHATAANDIRLRTGSTNRIVWDDSAGTLTFTAANGVFASADLSGVDIFATGLATTASAANAVLSATTGRLLRSTSSEIYKRAFEPLTLERVERIINEAIGFTYASNTELCRADSPTERWFGYGAHQIASVDHELVDFDNRGEPIRVQYERFVVPHGFMLKNLNDRVKAIEARLQ